MTPSPDVAAEPAAPAVAAGVLHDGEQIILAIRPSIWMVVLESLPAVAIAAVVAAATLLVRPDALNLPRSIVRAVVLAAVLVAVLRVGTVFLRWLGRLYLLTNRRVLRLGGVAAGDVADCPLGRVTAVTVLAGSAERCVGLGTLAFTIDGKLSNELGWTNIARPAAVAEEVGRAIRRFHGNGT
ncbi:MAG: PH domain-containing protein [Phycisphaerae bacterium]|nr:PH domain-containing protein [Phycisphaerae bacterium]